jgi:blue copper oxidase
MKKALLISLFYSVLFSIPLITSAQSFTNTLKIPDTLSGTKVGDTLVYNITMDITRKQIIPDGEIVKTFSFNNAGYLGPTIIWNKGTNVKMNVKNNLGQTTTLHWHGAHVPPLADGGPHDMIDAGTTWSPGFKILDDAATMWYHPHLHHTTMAQVQMGLAGMIIIKDPADNTGKQLPHTYGVDDIPVIIQDRHITSEGIDTTCSMGDTILVNGTYGPVLQVPAQLVRFRYLNGSSERVYYLGYSDFTKFNLIATDAGYTAKPYELDSMMLAPGERAEWVVDFTGRKGETLYLVSYGNQLGSDLPGGTVSNPSCDDSFLDLNGKLFNILKIEIVDPTPNPNPKLPGSFGQLDIPSLNDVARYRTKHLYSYNPDPDCTPFTIDSTVFDMNVINDTIRLDDVEVWTLINTNTSVEVAHPFHIHDIHFFILDINGDPVPDYLKGPKDVIVVRKNDTVRFITKFNTFATPVTPHDTYMYHCHILSHEDCGMMHQFVVTDDFVTGRNDAVSMKWEVFPNPATSAFNIKGNCNTQSRLEVIDFSGKVVSEKTLPAFSESTEISSEQLTSGLYQLRWIRNDGVFTRKLTVF